MPPGVGESDGGSRREVDWQRNISKSGHNCNPTASTRTMVRMTAVTLLAFAGLCLLLSVTPGPDTFLVLRISLQNAGAGLAAAFGSALASLVWAALVGVGSPQCWRTPPKCSAG